MNRNSILLVITIQHNISNNNSLNNIYIMFIFFRGEQLMHCRVITIIIFMNKKIIKFL